MPTHNPSRVTLSQGAATVTSINLGNGANTDVVVTLEQAQPDANYEVAYSFSGLSATILGNTTRSVLSKTASTVTVRLHNNALLGLSVGFTVLVTAYRNA